MSSKKNILRVNPKFEIVLNENDFKIINDDDKNDNGTYSYSLTNSIELKKEVGLAGSSMFHPFPVLNSSILPDIQTI